MRSRNKRIRTLKTRRRQRNLKGGTSPITSPKYYAQGKKYPPTEYAMAPSNSPKYEIPALASRTMYENDDDPLIVRHVQEETSSSVHSVKKKPTPWAPGAEYDFEPEKFTTGIYKHKSLIKIPE